MQSGNVSFSVRDWQAFLADWSDSAISLQREIGVDSLSDIADEALGRGTCLFPPATESQVASAEERLGVSLPKSYRRFLQASNGFALLALDAEDALMRPAEGVCWLRDGEPDLVRAWTSHPNDANDEEYFVYGPAQDCVHIRSSYFPSLLQVSDFVDSAAVMLNPLVMTDDGEWEGSDFGNEKPGANRFRSFEAMMHSLRDHSLANLRQTISFIEMMKHRPPHSGRT